MKTYSIESLAHIICTRVVLLYSLASLCALVHVIEFSSTFKSFKIAFSSPSTGALGYGFEYSYSIMERTRLAALGGDKTMACPMLAMISSEVWKTKEAKASEKEKPEWGPATERGIIWEATTATSFLLAGADILVMYHPKAIELTRQYIEKMMNPA